MVYAGVNGDYLDSKDDTLCDWLTNGYKFNVIQRMLIGGAVCEDFILWHEESRLPGHIYDEFMTRAKMAQPVICGWTVWPRM